MAEPLLDTIPRKNILNDVRQSAKLLGRGAYNVVYLGEWNGTPVAIKRFHPILARDENGDFSVSFRRFLHEFPLLRDCPHPHIIQYYGFLPAQEIGGLLVQSPGLVMERLQATLKDRYSQVPLLTEDDEVKITRGIASGLKYLHGRKILHRDLTTNNVLLTEAAGGAIHPKITDFGCSKFVPDLSTQNQLTLSMNPGAQCYMAPETQDVDEKGMVRYGPQADCYSLGIVVLSMLVRREPPSIFRDMQYRPQKDIADIRSHHALRQVVESCVQTNPSQRFTAAQVCEVIQSLQPHSHDSSTQGFTAGQGAGVHDYTGQEVGALKTQLSEARHHIESLQHQLEVHEQQREVGLPPRGERVAVGDYQHVQKEQQALLAERSELQAEVTSLRREKTTFENQQAACQASLEHYRQANQGLNFEITRLRANNQRLAEERDSAKLRFQVSCHQKAAAQCHRLTDGNAAGTTATGNTNPDALDAASRSNHLPLLSHGNSDHPHEWESYGTWPKGAETFNCKRPCVHNGHLYTSFAITVPGSVLTTKLFRLHLRDDDDTSRMAASWSEVALPTGRWHEWCYFFTYKACLYAIITPAAVHTGNYCIYCLEDTGGWRRLCELPERKFRFGLSVVSNYLLIFGGQSEEFRGRPTQSSHLVCLDEPFSSQWHAIAPLPCPCIDPRAVVQDGHAHILGYGGNGQQDLTTVISMDFSRTMTSLSWLTGMLPSTPSIRCAATRLPGKGIVIVGGQKLPGLNSTNEVCCCDMSEKKWQPLMPMKDACFEGHCVSHGKFLLCLGGYVKFGKWQKDIEVMRVSD